MEESIILIDELKQMWRDLSFEMQNNKKLKLEMFEKAFTQTYSLLSKHISENALDKRYIEMISEAYLFANIKDDTLDSMCISACVLTERMLTYYAFNNSSSVQEPSTVYIFEARRDIVLDFNNVNESITKLTKVFDDLYWKKVKA